MYKMYKMSQMSQNISKPPPACEAVRRRHIDLDGIRQDTIIFVVPILWPS